MILNMGSVANLHLVSSLSLFRISIIFSMHLSWLTQISANIYNIKATLKLLYGFMCLINQDMCYYSKLIEGSLPTILCIIIIINIYLSRSCSYF